MKKNIFYVLLGLLLGGIVMFLIMNNYAVEQSKALYGYSLTLLDTDRENSELAIAILNQAIGKYPPNYPAYISLASIYEEKHFVELALLAYKEALRYCPQTTDIEKSDAIYVKKKIGELSGVRGGADQGN